MTYRDFLAAPHSYKTREPKDKFTSALPTLESDPRLDRSSEKAFLRSLLRILDIPESSQLLVFSTTSLQLRFISPTNPRALYFNEDIYIGYIPGGRVEVIGIDPDLGAIFYIFDIPQNGGPLHFERSDRCMNCHAGEDSGHVPGLVVKSVIPGVSGGSLDAFRVGKSGHDIPLSERFGGWHVTGDRLTNHWGNAIGKFVGGEIQRVANPAGANFDLAKYLVPTSDILAHLVHEHQVGFVNRAVEATYRARTAAFLSGGKLSVEQEAELDATAAEFTKYLLFADEVPLPSGGIKADPAYAKAFQATGKNGDALRELDLETRLFKLRCSYMIYSAAFQGLPPTVKGRVFARLRGALVGDAREFAYLGQAEKREIYRIVKATVKELPPEW